MAVTGLFLIAFLLMHMFGNFKLLMGAEAFDHYSHFLREFLYPIFPKMVFLWLFRIALLASVVLHIWSATRLTLRKRAAVGGGDRYVTKKAMEPSYAARTMIWGGILIVLFLVLHILQYTAQVIRIGYAVPGELLESPYARVMAGFSAWWVVAFYGIAMLAVCMHLWHGFYSAFTTLGANVSSKSRSVLKGCAYAVSVFMYIGFMIPPVLVLLGVIS